MKWLNDLFKHRIVRSYLLRLPPYLRNQAGPNNTASHYSTQQILDAIKQLKLSDKYTIYAVVALSNETASKLYAQEMQLSEDALKIRHEVADLYLHGNRDFTIDDINTYAGISDADVPDLAGGE